MLTHSLPLVPYSMPLFVLAMVIEFLVLRRRARVAATAVANGQSATPRFRGYHGKDTLASLTLGVLSFFPGLLVTAASVPISLWAWNHRLFTLDTGWTTWVLAIVLVDLVEYWNHRAGHRVRFLWANHVQHHSSKELNFSTALRTPLTSFSNIVCFPWLAIFGIQPWIIFASFSINAIYQLWVHTEAIGKLPRPIEFLFVTPSHHRVHHGSDGQYIDKNFASIFIVFDRLFGTFQPEDEPVTYGLVHDIDTYNIWTIATHEYVSMFRDVFHVRGVRAKLGMILMPPGWQPAEAGALAA